MAKQTINVGTSANDDTGEFLRPAFIKINANFDELYAGGTDSFSGEYSDLNNKPPLGTAAALNVGIVEGDVVQVGAEGKLPALDGSLLTNIVGSGGSGGAIDISGTPLTTQVAVWTDNNTVQGVTTISGGATGQVLQKISGTDYDYGWASTSGSLAISGTPTVGQLAKWTDASTVEGVSTITLSYISDAGTLAAEDIADYNFVPDGGTTGQILAKIDGTSGNTEWIDVGLTELVQDTSPQLGGDLDFNDFSIGLITAEDGAKLHAVLASEVELNHSVGLEDNIQNQLDTKPTIFTSTVAPTAAPTAVGDFFIDTTLGIPYVATGTSSSADWFRMISGITDVVEVLEDLSDAESIALLGEMQGLTEDDVETITWATNSQINAGTTGDLFMKPVNFISSIWALKEAAIAIFNSDEAVATGDGKVGIPIPASFNGLNLKYAIATVHDKGVTGTTDVQLRRRRAGSNADMLTTKITIGDEWFAADGVINTSNDDFATGDMVYIDVDAVHSGTAPNGLSVALYAGV